MEEDVPPESGGSRQSSESVPGVQGGGVRPKQRFTRRGTNSRLLQSVAARAMKAREAGEH
jgi:hypothetical protein